MKLAQKMGQLQPFVDVFSQECTGQPASFGQTALSPQAAVQNRHADDLKATIEARATKRDALLAKQQARRFQLNQLKTTNGPTSCER